MLLAVASRHAAAEIWVEERGGNSQSAVLQRVPIWTVRYELPSHALRLIAVPHQQLRIPDEWSVLGAKGASLPLLDGAKSLLDPASGQDVRSFLRNVRRRHQLLTNFRQTGLGSETTWLS